MSVLTERGNRLLSGSPPAGLRAEYARLRFVQLDDVTDAARLDAVMGDLLPRVLPYSMRTERPHQISTGLLRDGCRLERVDVTSSAGGTPSAAAEEAVRAAFSDTGLTAFVDELLAGALPFVAELVGRRLRYDRTFLQVYREGDFIAPHGDTQTSRRIMLHLPVTLGCRTALRVLRDGWMEPYYDEPGSLRVQGPGIWHEVLPVLRLDRATDPLRVVVTVRLPYSDE
jgi:hypothetical protein